MPTAPEARARPLAKPLESFGSRDLPPATVFNAGTLTVIGDDRTNQTMRCRSSWVGVSFGWVWCAESVGIRPPSNLPEEDIDRANWTIISAAPRGDPITDLNRPEGTIVVR